MAREAAIKFARDEGLWDRSRKEAIVVLDLRMELVHRIVAIEDCQQIIGGLGGIRIREIVIRETFGVVEVTACQRELCQIRFESVGGEMITKVAVASSK